MSFCCGLNYFLRVVDPNGFYKLNISSYCWVQIERYEFLFKRAQISKTNFLTSDCKERIH